MLYNKIVKRVVQSIIYFIIKFGSGSSVTAAAAEQREHSITSFKSQSIIRPSVAWQLFEMK